MSPGEATNSTAVTVPAREKGRFLTTYSPEVGLALVERISQGETLSKLLDGSCRSYPSRPTFYKWLIAHPDLAKAYYLARELSAQSFEDEALDMAREIKRSPGDGTKVRAFSVALDQLRWSASKRDPGRFGQQSNVQIRVPVQINTTLDLGSEGGGGSTAEHPNIYQIDAAVRVEGIPQDTPGMEASTARKRVLVPLSAAAKTKLPFSKIARGEIE